MHSLPCQPQLSDNGGKYAEYSSADSWGANFLTTAVLETTLSVLETAYDTLASGCEIASAFSVWCVHMLLHTHDLSMHA